MTRRFHPSHLAPIGLIVVLVMLAATTFWGAATTQSATADLKIAATENGLFQQAVHLVDEEDEQQLSYWLQADSATQARFNATARQVTTTLRRVYQMDDPDDRPGDLRLLRLQQHYERAVHQFFAAAASGDSVGAAALVTDPIKPLAHRMQDAMADAAADERGRAMDSVTRLERAEGAVKRPTIVVFGCGLALVLILSVVLRAYQRRIDAATRAEMTRLEAAALSDHLTGLGNHRAFVEEMAREVERAEWQQGTIALALVDLDDFKLINDQHGHAHGDRVLAALGALLAGTSASARAFRLGGDEFAVILRATTERAAALRVDALRQEAPGRLFGATISAGVAGLTLDGGDAETLREQADAALYEAKRRGRNAVVTFGEIKDSAAIVSTAKILAVRRLLAEGQVRVAFQPIWSLERGEVLAFEALTRPDPSYELAGPQEAFDIAERIGRAHELDVVCCRAILARARELPPHVSLFVNISPQSLDHDLLRGDRLVREVTAAGLSPERIVLEITERSLARPAVVIREARRLRELGFRIALDDVGAGNAGLEMMRNLPVDFIKIDRAVVAGAVSDTTARSVLAAILAFAREARTLVIAEGIEDRPMLEMVEQTGRAATARSVHAVQGYLLGRPSETIPPLHALALPGAMIDMPDVA